MNGLILFEKTIEQTTETMLQENKNSGCNNKTIAAYESSYTSGLFSGCMFQVEKSTALCTIYLLILALPFPGLTPDG